MSEMVNGPEQLNLPFDTEDQVVSSARIFSLSERRRRAQFPCTGELAEPGSIDEISKALERKILDNVLAEAEKLPWYK